MNPNVKVRTQYRSRGKEERERRENRAGGIKHSPVLTVCELSEEDRKDFALLGG